MNLIYHANPQGVVQWLRAAAPYIHMHKDCTFVLAFDGSISKFDNFSGFIHDLNILLSIGVKIVLVHGVEVGLEDEMKSAGKLAQFTKSHRIIDKDTLDLAQRLSGDFRVELEAKLSAALPNSPMEGSNIRVISGNFVFAKPLGIVGGIDTMFSGEPRKIDTEGIKERLSKREVVLLSPIGFSPKGQIFLLKKEDVAKEVAISLNASKLIFLMTLEDIPDNHIPNTRELNTSEAKTLAETNLLKNETKDVLQTSIEYSESGIGRAHIVNNQSDGSLIVELFTHQGMGLLITQDPVASIRVANTKDMAAIMTLISPLQAQTILTPRSKEELELQINDFFVLEHDSAVVGCAALHIYSKEQIGELACLAIHENYQNEGAGKRLLGFIEEQGRKVNIKKLFVLTTKTSHWFVERGFRSQNFEELPLEKKRIYDHNRNSQILIKDL